MLEQFSLTSAELYVFQAWQLLRLFSTPFRIFLQFKKNGPIFKSRILDTGTTCRGDVSSIHIVLRVNTNLVLR